MKGKIFETLFNINVSLSRGFITVFPILFHFLLGRNPNFPLSDGDRRDVAVTFFEISSNSEEEGKTKVLKLEKEFRNKDWDSERRGTRVSGNSKKRARRYSDVEIWTADEKELDDDECCMLPSDPAGEIDLKQPISDPKQDDVSVLAERGEVACRDYPHPRQSCAEYPFSKTSHENCCSQCYCYVCDVAAPCCYWKGPNGHCHASSQDPKWSAMRRASRCSKSWRLNTCLTKISQ